MEIIGCGRGHFYDPNEYSSCPQCARESGDMDVLSVTEPVNFQKYASGVSAADVVNLVDFDSFVASGTDVGVTAPVDPEPAADFKNDCSSKVQDYAHTMPVSPVYASDNRGSTPISPVVGWLVCIEGAEKGKDYRIHSQYNHIGRGENMDICITGDECISTEKAAILAYDDQEKFFSFGPSMGHNVVRVNGKMLMNAVVLNAYDELTIGKTKLLFIPMCGERFDWNDK